MSIEIKTDIVIILDNIRSAHNVGSVFRTADAFMINKIFLCGITAQPPNRNISKVALGATDYIDWEYIPNTMEAIKYLKDKNYFLLAMEQDKKSMKLNDFEVMPNVKYALVFGNEINGIGEDILNICDKQLEIPQFGMKNSLNVSVAAGISIWNIFKNLYL